MGKLLKLWDAYEAKMTTCTGKLEFKADARRNADDPSPLLREILTQPIDKVPPIERFRRAIKRYNDGLEMQLEYKLNDAEEWKPCLTKEERAALKIKDFTPSVEIELRDYKNLVDAASKLKRGLEFEMLP